MNKQTKKKLMSLGLATVLTLSLSACGGKQPSLEEVRQAIEAGNLTVEDALDKGLVDQEWADEYYKANSVPAGNKMEAHAVNTFTTTTLDGKTFTREDLGGTVYLAFVDPSAEGAQAFYQALVDAYEGVTEKGAGIVLCSMGESGNELFEEAPFPVILYNDSLAEAMGGNRGMVEDEEPPNTGVWYMNGAFLSAWSLAVNADELVEDAAAFVEMSHEEAFSDTNGEGTDGSAAMVPMG